MVWRMERGAFQKLLCKNQSCGDESTSGFIGGLRFHFNPSDFRAAPGVGSCKPLLTGAKHIGLAPFIPLQKAVFRRLVRFQPAIGEDMADLGKTRCVPGNQNGPVAVQRIFLRAKKSDAVFQEPFVQPRQPRCECGRGSNQIKGNGPINVALGFVAAGPKLPTKENVMDARRLERKLKSLPGKPREMAAIGLRANIGNGLDSVIEQKLKERLHGMG